MKLISKLGVVLVCIAAVSGCGGGGGGGGGGSQDSGEQIQSDVQSNPEVYNGRLSGYVLDGAIENTRVCLDLNSDMQCTDVDSYVVTDNDGFFELLYSTDIDLASIELISDVRSSEANDADYEGNSPYYDYVMKAFSKDSNIVVISPLSTALRDRMVYEGESSQESLDYISGLIASAERHSYGVSSENTEDKQTLMLQNFVENQASSDLFTASFSSRIRSLNQILALKMQESQLNYENSFYGGNTPVFTDDWSNNSAVIVSSANANVFGGIEEIIDAVGFIDYNNFNVEYVNDSLELSVPAAHEIAPLLRAISGDRYDTVLYETSSYDDGYGTVGDRLRFFLINWAFLDENVGRFPGEDVGEIVYFETVDILFGSRFGSQVIDCDYWDFNQAGVENYDSLGTQGLISAFAASEYGSLYASWTETSEVSIDTVISACNSNFREVFEQFVSLSEQVDSDPQKVVVNPPKLNWSLSVPPPVIVKKSNPIRGTIQSGGPFGSATLDLRRRDCFISPCASIEK